MFDFILIDIVLLLLGATCLFLLWQSNIYRQQLHDSQQDCATFKKDYADLKRQHRAYLTLRDGLFTVLPDALLILKKGGNIAFANQAAKDLFQRPLIDQTLMMATRHFELENLVTMAIENPNEVQERRFVVEEHILQGRVLSIEDYCLILLHDVTVVQQLSRARRDMIANITHELNTPITTIRLLADTLLGGAMEKPEIGHKMLQNVRAETETLSQLVQEMRDLSLIESRQMPIKMVNCPLLPLVEQSIMPLMPLADRKSQQVVVNISDSIRVLADQNQMPRVLKNIVHNAIKYTQEGGHIVITATLDGEEVTIRCKDNGPGIGAHALERIFERFYQSDQSRQQGTGLGLAISRHIILAHGGEIWAENNNNSKGASFYLTLPIGD